MSDDTQETPGTAQSASEIVRRVQALGVDVEERERAISSLRWACDAADYDLMMAAGDLGGAEIDLWDMTL